MTVNELMEQLKQLIDQNKGDYTIRLESLDDFYDLEEVQDCDQNKCVYLK